MEGKILEMIEQEKEQESPYFIERCDADGTTYVIVGPDGDTLCDGDDFALEEAEYICEAVNTAYNAGRVSMDKTLESLRSQIPHPGDGSCDHCGRVPSVNIPTSLCRECRDGIKRAEKAELDLQRVEQERYAWRDTYQKLLDPLVQQATLQKMTEPTPPIIIKSSELWKRAEQAERDLAAAREALREIKQFAEERCGSSAFREVSAMIDAALEPKAEPKEE